MNYEGPRYVAGLRDKEDVTCYKDFFEGDKLEEAQQEADLAAEANNRNTIIYDRKEMNIIYRKVVQENTQAVVPPPKPTKTFRKSKKKEKKEEQVQPSKDDFF